jgi:heme/copper-type cytochrome/quinol oxidase subunit 3
MTHHIHVLIGILLNLWIMFRLTGGLTAYRLTGVRAIALYWYFVNVAAVAVVLTQLSPSL